jgi:pimeloyl-ACP methyl ester carboxylesterase
MPHHGLNDRLTDDLANLSTEEVVRFGSATVDIAQGLGDHVTVAGLSGGGVFAGLTAQQRSDVDSAVLIAPMLGVLNLPEYTIKPVTNAALTLPDLFVWWDSATKEKIPGPTYAYPRYPTKALAALLRLSAFVEWQAGKQAPATDRILVVTNEADTSVNNAVTDSVVRKWRLDGRLVETYTFPVQLKLPHDIIDPHKPDQQIGLVYPLLIELMTGQRAAGS